MTFPATLSSCLFSCLSAPKFELKAGFCRAVRESRNPRLSLKSGNPLTFSDFEGDLPPSDFEVNIQLRFAKTYAYHFSISAKDRGPPLLFSGIRSTCRLKIGFECETRSCDAPGTGHDPHLVLEEMGRMIFPNIT